MITLLIAFITEFAFYNSTYKSSLMICPTVREDSLSPHPDFLAVKYECFEIMDCVFIMFVPLIFNTVSGID